MVVLAYPPDPLAHTPLIVDICRCRTAWKELTYLCRNTLMMAVTGASALLCQSPTACSSAGDTTFLVPGLEWAWLCSPPPLSTAPPFPSCAASTHPAPVSVSPVPSVDFKCNQSICGARTGHVEPAHTTVSWGQLAAMAGMTNDGSAQEVRVTAPASLFSTSYLVRLGARMKAVRSQSHAQQQPNAWPVCATKGVSFNCGP